MQDKDNNACENINSIINKSISGKRINYYSLKGSYETRVEATVVSVNAGEYLSVTKKKLSGDGKSTDFLVSAQKRKRALLLMRHKAMTENGVRQKTSKKCQKKKTRPALWAG